MVKSSLGAKKVTDLDGATICTLAGATLELNIADYNRARNVKITPLLFDKADEAMAALEAGRCDGYTDDTGSLAGARGSMKKPGDWVVLGEVISKEPLGLLTRKGDDQWTDIVAWVRNALITAEELGITQANVEKLAKESDNPEVRRVLGMEGDFGKMLGVDNDWALSRAQDVRQLRRDLRAPFRGQGAGARARREPAVEPGRARLLLSVPLISIARGWA